MPFRPHARLRESLVWLGMVTAVALLEARLTRLQLNPDGVSYLDLADALRVGDWPAFVQGYWSPLYPTILAAFGLAGESVGVNALAAAHWANAVIVIAGAMLTHRFVTLLWRSLPFHVGARRELWTRAVWATYAMCALVLTKIDSITPDSLLLCVMIAIATELLVHGGGRSVLLGALLGLAYLAKTSSWPWLLVVLAATYLPWSRVASRGRPILTTGAMLAVMLPWAVPMSRTYDSFTLGATGRLNACWYLRHCDSRSPDTHEGGHREYQQVPIDDLRAATTANFAAVEWTYEPWSDPTAWAEGVITRDEEPWRPGAYAAVVAQNLGDAARYIGPFLYLPILTVILFWWGYTRAVHVRSELSHRALMVTALGAVGIAQFVAVHVEPRLLSPFAFMHVVALVAVAMGARTIARSDTTPTPRRMEKEPQRREQTTKASLPERALAWLPMLFVLPVVGQNVRGDMQVEQAVFAYRAEIESLSTQASRGFPRRTIVVAGEAFPLVAHARAIGARIVAQVLPASARTLATLSPVERQRVLREAGAGRADVAWEMRSDGRIAITPLN
ncbi:MAG: hypothetical protein ABIZ91_00750 [Gemmatimonadaceae bacterium]